MLLTTLALGFRAPVPLGRSAPHRRAFLDVRLCATPLALEEQLLQPELSAQEVSELISALAASPGAATEPALSPLIEGEWVLVHTSKSTFDVRNPLGRRADGSTPGLEGAFAALSGGAKVSAPSSSPIQRALTEAFSVTQSITLQGPDKRVLQCVETPLGTLRLGAKASVTPDAPARISFAFDEGYLALKRPLPLGVDRLPYPVPFRLLGKEAEGYLDTEYLSEKLRISVGNKGTKFVLRRA
jgi:hypothetical protein